MNVGELKEKLEDFDDDMPVSIEVKNTGTDRIQVCEYYGYVYISEDLAEKDGDSGE